MHNINYHDDKIKFFVDHTKNKKVLDLGVVQHSNDKHDDPNWLHRAIAVSSKECLGLDIDRDGIDYLKKKGFSVAYADAQDFNLSQTFDVVSAGDIIEHLSNVGGFLDSIRKHLNDDGYFLLSTPNPFWWKMAAFVAIKGHAPVHPQHTCWYCEQTLRQVFARHGFYIAKVQYGSVYNIGSLYHKITRMITALLPLPARFRHNTVMVVARKAVPS